MTKEIAQGQTGRHEEAAGCLVQDELAELQL
jgi:hypothetical protein